MCAVWRHTTGNVEPPSAQLTAVFPVRGEDFSALIRGLDFPELACPHIRIEHVEARIVGEKQRRMAARAGAGKGPSTARAIGRGSRQIPQGEPRKPSPGADQQRLLDLGQGYSRVLGFVAKRAFGHLKAKTKAPGSPAV